MNLLQGTRILIVDDDVILLEMLAHTFKRAGAKSYTAANGRDALRQFYDHQPHLIILDLMMPELNGLEIGRQIRQLSDIPIIILTAIHQDEQIVQSLTTIADDYIFKPVSPNILIARAEAVLRRTGRRSATDKLITYSDGYLMINLDRRLISVDNKTIRLSPKEYDLLAYLFQNAGHVVTIDQILQNVWDDEASGSAPYVHVYISQLRHKIEPDSGNPVYLLTERGVGYRFDKQSTTA